jgi:hypothetical protein
MRTVDSKPVTDPIITPFVKQWVARGFSIKKHGNGRADFLEECPHCKQKYRYTFIKEGVETKCCPHCEK